MRKIEVRKLPEPTDGALETYYIVDPQFTSDDDRWLLGCVALEDIGKHVGPNDWAWVIHDLQEDAEDPLVGDGHYVEYRQAISVAIGHFAGVGHE